MGDYSIELDGITFASAPEFDATSEVIHRLDSVPEKIAYVVWTITLPRCRVFTSDGTADKAQELFGTALAATIHDSGGVKPRWLKIKDAASAVIDEIGNIDTSTDTGWQELFVEALGIDGGPAQFKAGVEFTLRIRATKAFPDVNGLVLCERDWSSSIGPDRSEVRTLEARIEMEAGTTIDYSASWFLALVRLTKPAGWVQTIGGLDRFEVVSLPNYSREDRGLFRSQIKHLMGGVSAPTGAGGVSVVETRQELPELGLVRVTRSVEAVGASSGSAWLADQQPAEAHGETSAETGNTLQHRGSWTHYEPLAKAIGGKVYAIDVVRTLQPGGQVVRAARRTGNLKPMIRKGAVAEWVLLEEITLHALGVLTLADLPTLPAPPGPWEYDPEGSIERPAKRVEKRATRAQHRWEREIVRRYLWDGTGSPLDDATFKPCLTVSYEPGVKLS